MKGLLAIFSLLLTYLAFGFLGSLFLFYFWTQINIFHKYKTVSVIYNNYIKTMVHFCGVSSIHDINFTKLQVMHDRNYTFNYFIILFIFPIYQMGKILINYGEGYYRQYNPIHIYQQLGRVVAFYLLSNFSLYLYTILLYKSFKRLMDNNKLTLSNKEKIMNLIKERHYFFIIGIMAYALYVYVIYYFFEGFDILSIEIGLSIHAFQLIYTNKIIIKKYWSSPYTPKLSYETIEKMNAELLHSEYFL